MKCSSESSRPLLGGQLEGRPILGKDGIVLTAMVGHVPGESVRDHDEDVVDDLSVSSDVAKVESSVLDVLFSNLDCCVDLNVGTLVTAFTAVL